MSLTSAELIVDLLSLYAAAGFLFAIFFCWRGVARVDPAARESSAMFRLLIAPGIAALWPMFALRWWKGSPSPEERTAHRAAARRPTG